MSLTGDETEIVVLFDNAPTERVYTTIYDVTTDTYLSNDIGPYSLTYAVTYDNCPKGHKYKLGYRTTGDSTYISGRVNSY